MWPDSTRSGLTVPWCCCSWSKTPYHPPWTSYQWEAFINQVKKVFLRVMQWSEVSWEISGLIYLCLQRLNRVVKNCSVNNWGGGGGGSNPPFSPLQNKLLNSTAPAPSPDSYKDVLINLKKFISDTMFTLFSNSLADLGINTSASFALKASLSNPTHPTPPTKSLKANNQPFRVL